MAEDQQSNSSGSGQGEQKQTTTPPPAPDREKYDPSKQVRIINDSEDRQVYNQNKEKLNG